MTKTELIDTLTKETGLEKKHTKSFLEGLTSVIEKQMRKGGIVPLTGLGKFKVVRRKARMGRNPATGEPIKIPAKTVVRFSVAKNLKEIVKKLKP
ncbi:MAG: HU family DNA-binding protein [Vicinamibacteria bacterium]